MGNETVLIVVQLRQENSDLHEKIKQLEADAYASWEEGMGDDL